MNPLPLTPSILPVLDLKPPAVSDARFLCDAILESVDELSPWMEWAHPTYSIDQATAWIERSIADRKRGDAYEFLITGEGGKLLGVCGLNRISAADRLANLGYWIRSSAAGNGIMVRAVQQLAGWGFRNTTLHRLEIVVAAGNVRSQRVAEKAGAQREGILSSRIWLYEVPHDAVIYSITRDGEQRS